MQNTKNRWTESCHNPEATNVHKSVILEFLQIAKQT